MSLTHKGSNNKQFRYMGRIMIHMLESGFIYSFIWVKSLTSICLDSLLIVSSATDSHKQHDWRRRYVYNSYASGNSTSNHGNDCFSASAMVRNSDSAQSLYPTVVVFLNATHRSVYSDRDAEEDSVYIPLTSPGEERTATKESAISSVSSDAPLLFRRG